MNDATDGEVNGSVQCVKNVLLRPCFYTLEAKTQHKLIETNALGYSRHCIVTYVKPEFTKNSVP